MKKSALIFIFLIFGFFFSPKSVLAGPCLHNGGTDCCDKGNASSQVYNSANGYCSNSCAGTCYYEVGPGNYQTVACYPPSPFSYTALTPTNNSTSPNLTPTVTWSTNNCAANGAYSAAGIFSGSNCQGSAIYLSPQLSPTATSYTFTTNLLEGQPYSWNVYGLKPSGGNYTSNCNNFTTPIHPPTIVSSSISPSPVSPGGSATITVVANDVEGGSDIANVEAIINNGGQYHGHVGWSSNNFPNWIIKGAMLSDGSGGNCAIDSLYDSQVIINITGCTTSILNTQRTVTITFNFASSTAGLFVPVNGNVLSARAEDFSSLFSDSGSWKAGPTFSLTTPLTCQAPIGLTAWWNMDEPGGTSVGDYAGPNEGLATNDNYHSGLVGYWNLDSGGPTIQDSTTVNPGTPFGRSCTFTPASLNTNLVSYYKFDTNTNDSQGTNDGTGSGLGCNFNNNSYSNNLGEKLYSYWKLDEPSGSTVADSMGPNTGTGLSILAFSPDTSSSLTTGLRSYWNLDGPAGHAVFVPDIGPAGVNGTSGWGATSPTSVAGVKINNSFNFTSGVVEAANNPTTNTANWTISAWVKLGSASQHSVIAYNGNAASGYGFGLGNNCGDSGPCSPNGTSNLVGIFGGTWFRSGYNFGADTTNWHLVTMTRDSGGLTNFYVDKVQTTVKNYNASGPGIPALRFTIAAQYNSANNGLANYFSGGVDEVGVWNRGLNLSEITELYNSSSGNSYRNLGTPVAVAPGQIGANARTFNGISNYIQTALPATGSANFTVSAWIKRPTTAKVSANVADNDWITGNNLPTYSWYSAFDPTDHLTVYYYNSTGTYGTGWQTFPTGTVPRDGNWHHVAFVVSGISGAANNLTAYIDGAQAGQETITYNAISPSTSPVWIGGRSDVSAFFSGSIDEVAIWNRALSGPEINLIKGTTTPLSCDPGPKSVPSKNAGLGNAQAFGGNDQISVPNSVGLSFNNSFSVSAWVYPQDCSHGNNNFNTIAVKEGSFYLGFDNNCKLSSRVNIGGVWKDDFPASALPTKTWSHVAMTWDGNTISTYLNHVKLGAGTAATGTMNVTANNLYLGKRPDLPGYPQSFNGYIDEVGIWNRLLTQADVDNLWTSGNGLTCTAGSGSIVTFSPGKIGPALNLNGTTNYVSIPNSATMNVSAYSVSLWLYVPVQNQYYKGVFGKPGRNYNMWLANANDQDVKGAAKIFHHFHAGSNTDAGCPDTDYSVAFNAWNHIVITNDGTTCNTYVNNALKATGAVSGILAADAGTTYIGRGLDGQNDNYLKGYLDEIGMWNRALTGAEVANLYTVIPPYSSMLSSGPTADNTQKIVNYSRKFNGLGDYISVTDYPDLASPQMTVEAFVYPTALSNNPVIYSRQNASGTGGVSMELNSAGNLICKFNLGSGWVSSTSTTTVNTNTWTHVACSSGSAIKNYIAGNPAGSNNTSGSISNPTGSIYTTIGKNFTGYLDEVRVYNRALDTELLAEANPAKPVDQTACDASTCTATCGSSNVTHQCVNSYCTQVPVACSPTIGTIHILGQVMNQPAGVINACIVSGSTCDPSKKYPLTGNNYDIPVTTASTFTISLDNKTNLNPDQALVTISCTDTNSVAGPTFWYNSGAGIAIQGASPQSGYTGSGGVSENGLTPGFRLDQGYTSKAPLTKVNYQEFFNDVSKAYGLPTSPDPCVASLNTRTVSGNHSFFCYDNLDTAFGNALSTGSLPGATTPPGTNILYPKPGVGAQTISIARPNISGKHFVIFVNGNLAANANISDFTNPTFPLLSAVASAPNSTDIFVVNGNFTVTGTVTRLDGVYVFNGNFDDGATATQLIGRGSLIQTGTGKTFGLNRSVVAAPNNPAEGWIFEPKYLQTYSKIFFTPKFTWQELPPQ